jgi:uncharacterized protein (UPF0303 family)
MTEIIFDRFDQTDAWTLGVAMHAESTKRNYPIVIDIRRGETPMFSVMLPGASELNFDWARRKRNLTLLTGVASWTHAENLAQGDDVLAVMGLDPRDYTAHGGCVPIRVRGVGIVATVTISGLPQKEDHDFAMACLLDYLNGQKK